MKYELSKERLKHYAALPSQPFDEGASVFMYEVREMARALLAAHEQEPVAFVNSGYALCYFRPPQEYGLKIGDKLFRHPAPSIPAAVPQEAFEVALSVLNDTLDDCGDSDRGLLLALDRMGIEVRSDAMLNQTPGKAGEQ